MPHRVITDAVDVSAFAAPDRRYEDVGAAERPLRLVSVGRLHWKKGHEHALAGDLRALLDRGIDVALPDHRRRRPTASRSCSRSTTSGSSDHVELLGARAADEVQDAAALGRRAACRRRSRRASASR